MGMHIPKNTIYCFCGYKGNSMAYTTRKHGYGTEQEAETWAGKYG